MLRTILAALLCLAAQTASAQTIKGELPVERGVHARALTYGMGGVAIVPATKRSPAVGGVVTGFDIAIHRNHDVGLRAIVSFLGEVDGDSVWPMFAVAYRYHASIHVSEVAPFVELGVGAGFTNKCLRGDFCGGFGAAFHAAGGGEVGLQPYVSLIFGGHVLFQTGLANNVGVVTAPGLFFGLRAG